MWKVMKKILYRKPYLPHNTLGKVYNYVPSIVKVFPKYVVSHLSDFCVTFIIINS